MKTLYLIVIVSLMLFGLASCSKPYLKPDIDAQGSEFTGIVNLMEASQSKSASMIMIHGMCFHCAKWIRKSATTLASSLQMDVSNMKDVTVNDGKGVIVRRIDLTRNNYHLRVYGIVYSTINEGEKQKELCYDSENSAFCPNDGDNLWKRASLNNLLKSNLMNECLADAVMYLGPSGEKVREGVSAALDAIYDDIENDAELKGSPVAYYSESLGSKILRDALICDANSNGILNKNHMTTIRLTYAFYMAANQIPMLNLGDGGQTCASTKKEMALSAGQGGIGDLFMLFDPIYEKLDNGEHGFNVVAFTDPNDILSYPLKSQHAAGRKVSNVIVSNKFTWFGALENPWGAHTDYLGNCKVVDLMAYGTQREKTSTCVVQEDGELQ